MTIYPFSLFRESNYLDYYEFTEHFIFINIGFNKKILDIGCRNGLFTNRIFNSTSAKAIIGIDIDSNVIEEANKDNINEKIKYYCSDGEDIKFLSNFGKFDIIHLRNTFHHFNEPERFLKNIIELLEPDGVLIIVDIDRESMFLNFGNFSLGEFITWLTIINKIGFVKAIVSIRKVGFLSREYRVHHKEDVIKQLSVGWYNKNKIKANLNSLFNQYLYGRIGDLFGIGGVYYIIYKNK